MAYRPKIFAAVDLDERSRAQCAAVAHRLGALGLDARFEPQEKLHVTLAFLGSIQPERIAEISAALQEVAQRHQPFELTLDKIGAFPHERNPHVVWIGAKEQGAPFRELARDARRACESLGFSFEKDVVAHVTIARIKRPRAHLPMIEVRPIAVPVDAITLFDSVPGGATSRYEARYRCALGANR